MIYFRVGVLFVMYGRDECRALYPRSLSPEENTDQIAFRIAPRRLPIIDRRFRSFLFLAILLIVVPHTSVSSATAMGTSIRGKAWRIAPGSHTLPARV